VGKVTVVINTLNEERTLPRALASVKHFADEVIVCDMESSDGTREIAEKAHAMVYIHKNPGYVEPTRNFAISKAGGEWILILDPDEELPKGLATKLKEIIKNPNADYFRIPRKNIVFGKWMRYTRFWPDFNIRFFKKGFVTWNEVIHSVPMTQGKGADLPDKEEFALVHHHYDSIEEYLERMNRYTSVQAEALIKKKHKFLWKDLIEAPASEFLSRYFAGEGYKDGLHGLATSLLQAFSEVILYLKVWQAEKFLEQSISPEEIESEYRRERKDFDFWITEVAIRSKDFLTSLPLRVARRILRKNAE